MALTAKQKRFIDEYLIDLNATQAAIRAGYSEKTAYSIGQRILKNVEVKNYIDDYVEELHSQRTANAQEVIEYLTLVMRGESTGEEVITELIGDGMSKAKKITKHPSEKDKLKAAELLGKRFGLFTDKTQVEVITPVFEGEENLEE